MIAEGANHSIPTLPTEKRLSVAVVVASRAHGLPGAIDQEMVDQMTPAEGREPLAVKKPVQPVAGKFRNHDGIHQRGNDSNEGDVQAFVKHGCFSLLLAAAPEAGFRC